MSNILLISGHPNLDASVASKTVVEKLKEHFGKDLTVRRLDQTISNGAFNVEAEQQALVDADTIVLQFPMHWYSSPALLKQWMDDVLLHGFSHGSEGTALHGKKLLVSVTAGAGQDVYENILPHDFDILMAPYENTAKLTGMEYLGHVNSFAAFTMPGMEVEPVIERSEAQAQKVIAILSAQS